MVIDIHKGKLVIEASREEWGRLFEQVPAESLPARELNFAIHCVLQQENL